MRGPVLMNIFNDLNKILESVSIKRTRDRREEKEYPESQKVRRLNKKQKLDETRRKVLSSRSSAAESRENRGQQFVLEK